MGFFFQYTKWNVMCANVRKYLYIFFFLSLFSPRRDAFLVLSTYTCLYRFSLSVRYLPENDRQIPLFMCANYAFLAHRRTKKKKPVRTRNTLLLVRYRFFSLQRQIVDLAIGVFRKRKPMNFASETSKLRVLSHSCSKNILIHKRISTPSKVWSPLLLNTRSFVPDNRSDFFAIFWNFNSVFDRSWVDKPFPVLPPTSASVQTEKSFHKQLVFYCRTDFVRFYVRLICTVWNFWTIKKKTPVQLLN